MLNYIYSFNALSIMVFEGSVVGSFDCVELEEDTIFLVSCNFNMEMEL